MKFDPENLRREYTRDTLSRCEMPADPIMMMSRWIDEAIQAGLYDPTALVLATVSPEGKPSTRTVLLRELDGDRLLFYTNYDSRKGKQLAGNPNVSATLAWYPLERQIHIEGWVEKTPARQSDEYFASRPVESRIAARISPQSQVISSRMALLRRFETEKQSNQTYLRPAYWGGYTITPVRIEFWQGREYRLHDRILYLKQPDDRWTKERLAP